MSDRAIGGLVVAVILAALVIGLLGCSVRWQHIPRPGEPGVRTYAVEFRWGAAAFREPPIWATGCGTGKSLRPCP